MLDINICMTGITCLGRSSEIDFFLSLDLTMAAPLISSNAGGSITAFHLLMHPRTRLTAKIESECCHHLIILSFSRDRFSGLLLEAHGIWKIHGFRVSSRLIDQHYPFWKALRMGLATFEICGFVCSLSKKVLGVRDMKCTADSILNVCSLEGSRTTRLVILSIELGSSRHTNTYATIIDTPVPIVTG